MNVKMLTFMRTDIRSLYDRVYRKGTCQEKRLIVELEVINEAITDSWVTEVQCVDPKVDLTDALTKNMVPHGPLQAISAAVPP